MNDAYKKISINLKYSYLVIAKSTMLNNEFKLIKETLFQEFNKIKKWIFLRTLWSNLSKFTNIW